MPARPSRYTPELAERILRELRAGRSVAEICRADGMPCRDTVFEWTRQDRDDFAARYREARETGHGRPGYLAYSPEIAEAVLEGLMAGRTLSEVCGEPGMPGLTTVSTWVATDRDGFAARYRAAREVGERRQAEVAYSAAVADRLIRGLANGQPLREVCAEPDMPSTAAVLNWVSADRDGFRERYYQARVAGGYAIAGDMMRIVDDRGNDVITRRRDDGSIETILDPERIKRAELRVNTRRWLLPRLLPRIFGDRQQPRQEGGGATADELAEMMKLIDRRSRALPGEAPAADDDLPPGEDRA